MVNIADILYALVSALKQQIPECKHYFGKIPEKHSAPCFLYLLVSSKDTAVNFFTKKTVVDIQVIYFAPDDGYGTQDFANQMDCIERIKQFLSGFSLNIGDRNIKFVYSLSMVDEQLSIEIQFAFLDDAVHLVHDEQQSHLMIENICINDKEMI